MKECRHIDKFGRCNFKTFEISNFCRDAVNNNCYYKQLAKAEKTIEELKEEMKLAPLCVRGCEVDCEIKTLRYKLKLKDKVIELMLADYISDNPNRMYEPLEDYNLSVDHYTAQAIKEMEGE